jgi:Tol biopolymer transport system component
LAGIEERIWVMNADGSSPTPLTKLTQASSGNTVWSPSGAQLFFDSSRALDGSDALNTNNTGDIWVINTDGSGATALTKLTAPTLNTLVKDLLSRLVDRSTIKASR